MAAKVFFLPRRECELFPPCCGFLAANSSTEEEALWKRGSNTIFFFHFRIDSNNSALNLHDSLFLGGFRDCGGPVATCWGTSWFTTPLHYVRT